MMNKPSKFRLLLFAGFHLTDNKGQSIDPGPRKSKALLAWLAVNPDVEHPRERLAALLWPDSEEGQARHSLRQALASLRKVMPDTAGPLRSSKNWVLLDSRMIEVDALEFDAAISSVSQKMLDKAINLYQGEFLAGCNPRADLFDEWLLDYRHHYQARVTASMCKRLDFLIENKAYKKAGPLAIKLLGIDPLRESAYRALMQSNMALGNHAVALRWYRRCERRLLRELNVMPSPETSALYKQLHSAPDAAKEGANGQSSNRKTKKQALDIVSRGNQRILYQVEAAIEAVFDHIGGQSFLIRGGDEGERSSICEDISKLAKSQDFQVCRGKIPASSDDRNSDETSVLTATIAGCLMNTTPALKQDNGGELAQTSNLSVDDQMLVFSERIKISSKHAPLLLVLEDIHIADSQTIEQLAKLISFMRDSAALLVMTTSFSGSALDPAWRGAMHQAPLTTVDLATS